MRMRISIECSLPIGSLDVYTRVAESVAPRVHMADVARHATVDYRIVIGSATSPWGSRVRVLRHPPGLQGCLAGSELLRALGISPGAATEWLC